MSMSNNVNFDGMWQYHVYDLYDISWNIYLRNSNIFFWHCVCIFGKYDNIPWWTWISYDMKCFLMSGTGTGNMWLTCQKGPITETLSTAYRTADIAIEAGIVTIQESPIFLNTFKSTVLRPPDTELVSTIPRAIPPPTTAMTWQWVVEVGMPRKEQSITTRDAERTTINPWEYFD